MRFLAAALLLAALCSAIVSRRMVKLQQMRWTKPGTHLLLQIRTHVLNDELRSRFRNWYPAMKAA